MATELEACRFLDSEIGMCNYYRATNHGYSFVFVPINERDIEAPYALKGELAACPNDHEALRGLFRCALCRKRLQLVMGQDPYDGVRIIPDVLTIDPVRVRRGDVVERYCSKACAEAAECVMTIPKQQPPPEATLPYQVPPEYPDAWQTAYKTFALGVEGVIASSSLSTTPLKQVLAEADILGRERLIELTMRKWADGGGAMTRWFAERYVDRLAVEIGEKAAERLAKCAGWWTESDRKVEVF